MNTQFLTKVNQTVKENPKLAKALDIFERTQKIYEQAVGATTLQPRVNTRGTYSSSISKKGYYANLSTTTQ